MKKTWYLPSLVKTSVLLLESESHMSTSLFSNNNFVAIPATLEGPMADPTQSTSLVVVNTRIGFAPVAHAAIEMIVDMYEKLFWNPIWQIKVTARKEDDQIKLDAIMASLGPDGPQSEGCPSFSTLCAGQMNMRNAKKLHDFDHTFPGTNKLVAWMMSKAVMAEHGYTTFNPKNWVLKYAARWLLRQIIREQIKAALKANFIMNEQGDYPYLTKLTFGPGQRQHLGTKIEMDMDQHGVARLDDKGAVEAVYNNWYETPIVGELTIAEERHEVRLLRLSTGIARTSEGQPNGVIPAIVPDGRGGFRPGQALHYFFFWDLDTKTLKRRRGDKLMAFAVGLVPKSILDRWASVVMHPDRLRGLDPEQIKTREKDMVIGHIPNMIGNPNNQRMIIWPRGVQYAKGLTPLFKKGRGRQPDTPVKWNEQDPTKSGDAQVLATVAGKRGFWERRGPEVIFTNVDGVPQLKPQMCAVDEFPGYIKFKIIGLADETAQTVDTSDIMAGQTSTTIPGVLELLGLDLHATRTAIGRAWRKLKGQPPMLGMMQRGLIVQTDTPATARRTWAGLENRLIMTARQELDDAMEQMKTLLTTAGPQSDGRPDCATLCGGEPTPEALRDAAECRDTNPVIDWILSKEITQKLGITEWKPGSHILKTIAKAVIKEMAAAEGRTIAERERRRKKKAAAPADGDTQEELVTNR